MWCRALWRRFFFFLPFTFAAFVGFVGVPASPCGLPVVVRTNRHGYLSFGALVAMSGHAGVDCGHEPWFYVKGCVSFFFPPHMPWGAVPFPRTDACSRWPCLAVFNLGG